MMLGPKPGGKKDMKKAAKPGSSTPDHKGEDSSASEAEPATSTQKKEKPSSSKSHGSSRGDSKATKRKLFMVSNILDEGDEKKTPERKRKKTGDDASASTPSRPIPLSERQQLALIMQMTAAESGSPGSPSGASNDRRSSEPSSAKKKNDKVNKRNERGETPLHMAAIKGDADLLRQLIKQGAEVNAKDFAGWTPLHEACNHGYYEVAKMLLQAGANVNTQGLDDDTPLHDAASNGHPHQIVELLLKHGADPLQANTKGKTPIDVADNETVERLLKSETIASSSDSSDSLDVKSPTSPESLASNNDETSAGKKSGDRERKHPEGNEFPAEETEHGSTTKPKETAERHRHPSKGEFSKSPARCSTKSPSNIFEKIEKISAIKKEADRRFAFESSDSDRSRSSTPEIRLSRIPKPREDGKEKTPRDKVKVLKTYSRSSESRKDQEPVERTEDVVAKPSQSEAEVSEKHRHKQTLPERHFDSDSEMEVSSVSSSVSRDESAERKESKKESKKEAKVHSDSNVKTPKLDGKHHDKGTKRKREEDATSSVGSSSTSCETKEKSSTEVKVKHKHLAKRSGIPGTMPDGTLKKKIKGDKIRDSEKREKSKHANSEGKKSEERRTKDLEGRSEARKEKENEGKNSPQGGEIRRHSLPDLSASTKKEKLKELKKMASLDKAEEGMFGRMLHSSHSKSKGDETKTKAETSRSEGHDAGTEKPSEKHSKSEKAEKKLDGQERHSKTDKVEVKLHRGERSEGKISKGERSEDKSAKVDRSEEKRLKLEKAEKRHKSEHKSKEPKGEHSQKVPHANTKSDSIQSNSKSDSGKHKRKDEQKHHKIKSESSHSSDKVSKHKSDKLKPVNLERMKSSSSESLQSSTSSEVKSEKHSPKTEKLKLDKHKAELKAATLDRLKSSSSESLQSTDSFKGDRQKVKHHEGKGDGGKGSPQLERTSMDSPKVHRAQEKSVRSDSCNSEKSGIESPATDKPREKVKSHKGEKSGHGHDSPRTEKHREKERHRSGSSKESPVKDRTKEKHRLEHGKEIKKGAESPRDDKLFPWKTDRTGLDSPKRDKSKVDVTNKVDGSKVKDVTKVKHNSKGEKVKVEGSKRVENKPHSHNQDLFKPDKTHLVKPEKLKTFDLFEGETTDKSKHLKIVRIPKVKKDSDKGDSLRTEKTKEGSKHELAAKSEHHKTDKEKLVLKAEKSRGDGERKERVKLDGKDSHGDGSKPHKIKSDKHKGESSKHVSSKSKSDKERLKLKEKRPESSTNVTSEIPEKDKPEKEKPALPQKEERPTLSFPAIPSYLREEPESMKEKYIKVSPKTESIVTLEADLSEKPLPERSSLESKDAEDKFVEPFNKSPLGRTDNIKETTLQLTPSVSLSPSESFTTTTTSSTVLKASITTVSTVISPVTVTTTTVSYTASTAVSSTSITVSSASTTSSPSPVVRPPVVRPPVVMSASVTSTFSSQTVATTSVPVTTSPALATTTTSSTMTFTSSKPQGVIAGPVVTQASTPTNADYLKSLLLKPKVSQMIVSERPPVRNAEPTTSVPAEESMPSSREEPLADAKETTVATPPVVEPPAEKEKPITPSDQLPVKETFPKSQPTPRLGFLSNDSVPARSTTLQASIPVHVITPTPSSKPPEAEKTTPEIPAPTPVPLPRKEELPTLSIPPIDMVISTSVTVTTPSNTVPSKPEVKSITTDIQPAATSKESIEPSSAEAKTVLPGPSEVFISTSSSIPTVPVVVSSVELVETTVVTTVCVETSSSTNTSVALPVAGQPTFSLALPAANLVRPPATSSPTIKQEEDSEDKPQRITRSMRSTSSQASTPPIPTDKLLLQEDSNSQTSMGPIKMEGQATSVEDSLENVHPFRRKVLKVKNIASLDEPYERPHPEKPNPYWEYLNIRKVILERRQNMSVVIPKPPQCFDEYLLYQCSYLLHNSPAKSLIIPMYTPPASLPEEMTELFVEQEKARHKIRLEHYLEREKLIMSCEQEILRVHCRAARAHANQSVPFSACKILLDEEVYNVPPEQRTEDKPQGRDRFTARQFHSWLQDVDEKYETAKNCLLLRHHHEATSLQAVQKMEWQLRLQDLGYKDVKSLTDINDFYVPMVTVSEDFDLLPA
ncbi:ANKRD11 [Branchiostoma lanceolatum]|uniref:ANKRD11 protein n=1 Tax=Branchiostoma lanceolatum TaxID=7740 RepID=A0A8K0EWH3_BRALA|nr:ANKRD11 [Branchiostoma lanceolatum]